MKLHYYEECTRQHSLLINLMEMGTLRRLISLLEGWKRIPSLDAPWWSKWKLTQFYVLYDRLYWACWSLIYLLLCADNYLVLCKSIDAFSDRDLCEVHKMLNASPVMKKMGCAVIFYHVSVYGMRETYLFSSREDILSSDRLKTLKFKSLAVHWIKHTILTWEDCVILTGGFLWVSFVIRLVFSSNLTLCWLEFLMKLDRCAERAFCFTTWF